MASDYRNQLDELRRSAERFQETAERAGPAASVGYTLIGAILMFGAIGYGIDAWRGTQPWGLLIGLLLGIIVGMYELAKTVFSKPGR